MICLVSAEGGGGGSTEEKSGTGKESPAEGVVNVSTVSAGMGQEALLSLLEARVTDLCAELDSIDAPLRDSIFQVCLLSLCVHSVFFLSLSVFFLTCIICSVLLLLNFCLYFFFLFFFSPFFIYFILFLCIFQDSFSSFLRL